MYEIDRDSTAKVDSLFVGEKVTSLALSYHQ